MKKSAACAVVLLLLTSCNLVSSYNAASLFLNYTPSGHCPDLTLVNYGPDNISFLTGDKSSAEVKVGASGPLSRIVGSEQRSNGSYPMGGGVVKNGASYTYDLGLKCSPTSPEVRLSSAVYSTLILAEDPTTASGLKVAVAPPLGSY